jgi:hypothetical protein
MSGLLALFALPTMTGDYQPVRLPGRRRVVNCDFVSAGLNNIDYGAMDLRTVCPDHQMLSPPIRKKRTGGIQTAYPPPCMSIFIR